MKFTMTICCCLLLSCAYAQDKSRAQKTDRLYTAYQTEKNYANALAYMRMADTVTKDTAKILAVLEDVFSRCEVTDRFNNDTWYFIERYVTDLRSPLIHRILNDKYWANRLCGMERINHKLSELMVSFVSDQFSEKAPKASLEDQNRYLELFNMMDLSEFDRGGLYAQLLQLKLEKDYARILSVLQFAIPNVPNGEDKINLMRIMIRCGELAPNEIPRVKSSIERNILECFLEADNYKKLIETL